MSYEQYETLLKAKFSLLHELHTCLPREKPIIRRNIAELDRQLAGAPREFLRQYATTTPMVG
ncbi:MAG: hypothetical protein Q7S16_04905 [bacterium]|nr:hypothetical protein [bacterium]